MYDVAIIGAGPIGLSLAVALKQRGYAYLHLDAAQVGHTFTWWSPGTRFFSSNDRISIAGVPLITPDGNKSTREHYLAYLRGVVQQFDLPIRRYEKATALKTNSDGTFTLTTAKHNVESTYQARHVVLATGGTAAARRLNVPGEDLPHVTHYFQDAHQYFGQRLLIIGGRNTAAEAALRAHHAGAQVSLSYRQPTLPHKSIKYWLLPELQNLIDTGKITAHYNTTPTEITPTHATLQTGNCGAIQVPTDFVLLATGYIADMFLFESVGADLHPKTKAPLFNPDTMETSIPNLYVAGTAVAGTQDRYEVFLENCHVHVPRILAALGGIKTHLPTPTFSRPET